MKPSNKIFSQGAFTRTELVAVIVVLFALFFILGLVDFGAPKAGEKAKRSRCVNNLKQVGLAFRTWGDATADFPMSRSTNQEGSKEFVAGGKAFHHFQVMSNELCNPEILWCPADTERRPPADFINFGDNNISYFVGVDADEKFPAMLLTGDRNLLTNGFPVKSGLVTLGSNDILGWSMAMHKGVGNIGLADGSVQNASSAGLRQFLQRSGTNVNRLAVP